MAAQRKSSTIEWTAIGIKHTLKAEDAHARHVEGIYKKLQELIQGQQPPIHIQTCKKSEMVLWFHNADVANKYMAAIRQSQQKWEVEFGVQRSKKDSLWMKSKWIEMRNLPRGTTRKQIEYHIAQHGEIRIPERDIHLGHVDGESTAKDWAWVECPSNEDAVKMV